MHAGPVRVLATPSAMRLTEAKRYLAGRPVRSNPARFRPTDLAYTTCMGTFANGRPISGMTPTNRLPWMADQPWEDTDRCGWCAEADGVTMPPRCALRRACAQRNPSNPI